MGFILQTAIKLTGGLAPEVERVCEPAGFDGEWVTIADVSGNAIFAFDGNPFRIRRRQRVVFATTEEALASFTENKSCN